ncbi:MAG TPA: sulfurtransferase [Planctomycetes bacterium]|nr:sulfurtransferase [Planctomycetota bacterium]
MFPVAWSGVGFFVVNLLLGVGFGIALQRSGFGDSRRIAGQFYLTDLTVLKVMFTAIVVAMLLVLWSSALGVLDLDKVFVDPTYFGPGILGGFILGMGMIIGGYCPGTSLVASSNFKIDGMFFVGGLFVGIFAFGETVPDFWNFFQTSGAHGTYTLDQWLGASKGMTAILVTLMALSAFWGVSKLEAARDPQFTPSPVARWGAAVLVLLAVGLLFVPQPGLDAKIRRMKPELTRLLEKRAVQIDPAELVDLMHNNQVKLVLLDLRDESDFNLFHLLDAKHVSLDDLRGDFPETIDPISIVILMSNDEERATEGWKILRARGLEGSYILDGGINKWLAVYGSVADVKPIPLRQVTAKGALRFTFPAAYGDRINIAWPDPDHMKLPVRKYEKKAKSMKPVALAGGGCG